MSHIFIAHVEEDAEVALKIARGLEEAGYKTWCYEVDSVPGPSYIVRTGESVAQSQAVVVVISPHSLGSSQVTKEVVRAHESDKRFIPILRDITHGEFQQRQPEWREAIGSATSIRIPPDGIETVIPDIIEGARLLGIEPDVKIDSKRISRISKALDEIHNLPASKESKVAQQPTKEVKKSRKPLLIALASIIVIAIIIAVIFLSRGGNKDQDKGLTSTTPVVTSTASPSTTPSTTVSDTPKPTLTTTPTSTPTTASTPTPTPATDLKPDLVIQEISWSPKSPYVEDDVTFTIVMTNRGKDKTVSSYVAYYIDGAFQDTITVNPLDSGATGKTSFTWKAELGTHIIKAIADFNDSVAESDETNNEKAIDFSATVAADLIVQDVTWSPASPSSNQKVYFTVTIKNQGNGTAGNFYVQCYIDGSALGGSINAENLYAGQTTTVIFEWTARSGNHIFKADADYINAIQESDESNDSKTITIVIP